MADNLTLEIEGFDELLQRIEQLEQGSGPFGDMIVNTMEKALIPLEQAIKDRTPKNLGHLQGSLGSFIRGSPVSRGRPAEIRGIVATSSLYGEAVEYGRAAGKMPPVDAIQLWVHRKGLAGVYSWKSGRKLRGKADVEAEMKRERSMAWGIALKIAREGTEGAHMFRDGLEAARPEIEKLFDQLRDDIVKGLAE
ncbi:MAG TPA: hypothetical protein VMV87_03475 [Burkholderiales bacterium]|nr:hypothetical protein [Burkholderiales bacterium]